MSREEVLLKFFENFLGSLVVFQAFRLLLLFLLGQLLVGVRIGNHGQPAFEVKNYHGIPNHSEQFSDDFVSEISQSSKINLFGMFTEASYPKKDLYHEQKV
jgi:hypothetical protein